MKEETAVIEKLKMPVASENASRHAGQVLNVNSKILDDLVNLKHLREKRAAEVAKAKKALETEARLNGEAAKFFTTEVLNIGDGKKDLDETPRVLKGGME